LSYRPAWLGIDSWAPSKAYRYGPCSREKILLSTVNARCLASTGSSRKIFTTRANVASFYLVAAQHLVSPFASPFFGVKFLIAMDSKDI
jgi:hypothetical protein